MDLEIKLQRSGSRINMWDHHHYGFGYRFPDISSAQRFLGEQLRDAVNIGSALLYS